MKPLPLTQTHGEPGGLVLRAIPAIGDRPHCTLHGAMLRVSPDAYWYRCATCNIGCEDTLRQKRSVNVPQGLVSQEQTGYDALDWDRIHAAAEQEQQRWKNGEPWSREAKVGRAVAAEIARQKSEQDERKSRGPAPQGS